MLQAAIDCIPPTAIGIGNRRLFSADASQLPVITDPDVQRAFKDLMAASWDEIPEGAIHCVKEALSKTTEDTAGQEALVNVFRAAEAVEHFAGVLVSLKMELDDSIGLSGEHGTMETIFHWDYGESIKLTQDGFELMQEKAVPDIDVDLFSQKSGYLANYLDDALRAAYKRYKVYLDAFGPDETYLRKKVEVELGGKMIHLKMRCSGLEPEWGKSWGHLGYLDLMLNKELHDTIDNQFWK
ncbi:hypothetical protein ACLOJK_016497, partial [Asimina triloba]